MYLTHLHMLRFGAECLVLITSPTLNAITCTQKQLLNIIHTSVISLLAIVPCDCSGVLRHGWKTKVGVQGRIQGGGGGHGGPMPPPSVLNKN